MLPILILIALSAQGAIDLTRYRIVAPKDQVAATVLGEEIGKRTGLRPGATGMVIELKTDATMPAEGYAVETKADRITLRARGTRGLLYASGALLMRLEMGPARLELAEPLNVQSAPIYPLRGHQLGYRATANSWDAWSVEQYDQYIRELVLIGTNAIENIPEQDSKPAPLMKLPRRQMNKEISRICAKYDIEYWVWLPADFELTEKDKRAKMLENFEQMVGEAARLDGVFVPGGDPGHNAPELVMPFLEDLGKRTKAKIWLSLQGFNREREEWSYKWIREKQPQWLGGLVAGPSSPPETRSRENLPAQYGLRLYPDITHNKICQYQVPHLDQAIALTLGREAVNPRPAEMALIHNRVAPTSIGFLSYSDGVHDDFNKAIFTALAWDPTRSAREVMIDFARLHFSTTHARAIADAIFALERNWNGPLVTNGNVEATLTEWRRLVALLPNLSGNWRWQMLELRAVYDAYVRRRLIHETALEQEMNRELLKGGTAAERISRATAVLGRWPLGDPLRQEIIDICERLFQSVQLQTSVRKYGASGAERGAVLDFIDVPLNNRYWLEDEFRKVGAMASEAARIERLEEIARWENPGPGSYYDDIGHEGRSPRAEMDDRDEPLFWWLDNGQSRLRLSQQTTMWPKRLSYVGLDPKGTYTVKTGGQGQSLLSIDGKRVNGTGKDGVWTFVVPADALTDGQLELTFAIPTDEQHLNWRQRSRLAEVWLLKK